MTISRVEISVPTAEKVTVTEDTLSGCRWVATHPTGLRGSSAGSVSGSTERERAAKRWQRVLETL